MDFEEVHLDSHHENAENVEEAIIAVRRNGVALKVTRLSRRISVKLLSSRNAIVDVQGNIETREHSRHFRSRNVEFRLKLDLFANVIHCKSQPGIQVCDHACSTVSSLTIVFQTRHKGIDIVLIRQNTEGEYSCLEHENVHGVVESLKIITRDKSEKIARYA